jgi:hypothetical protein
MLLVQKPEKIRRDGVQVLSNHAILMALGIFLSAPIRQVIELFGGPPSLVRHKGQQVDTWALWICVLLRRRGSKRCEMGADWKERALLQRIGRVIGWPHSTVKDRLVAVCAVIIASPIAIRWRDDGVHADSKG